MLINPRPDSISAGPRAFMNNYMDLVIFFRNKKKNKYILIKMIGVNEES